MAGSASAGFYAYRTRARAWAHLQSFIEGGNGSEALGWAFGRVSLWGRIVECEDGWRAEYAYPYELEVYACDGVAGQLARRLRRRRRRAGAAAGARA